MKPRDQALEPIKYRMKQLISSPWWHSLSQHRHNVLTVPPGGVKKAAGHQPAPKTTPPEGTANSEPMTCNIRNATNNMN